MSEVWKELQSATREVEEVQRGTEARVNTAARRGAGELPCDRQESSGIERAEDLADVGATDGTGDRPEVQDADGDEPGAQATVGWISGV